MGNWHISIQGVGIHHNGIEKDADQRFKQLVEQLEEDGHNVTEATFTYGARATVEQISDLKTE